MRHTDGQKAEEWKSVVKMTMIIRDIMLGNPKLKELGFMKKAWAAMPSQEDDEALV